MDRLREIVKEAGIESFAVCNADRFDDVAIILEAAKANNALPPFTSDDIELRVDPERTLAGAKSFIVILSPYTPAVYAPTPGPYGNIAPTACGEDYHRIVMRSLQVITDELIKTYPGHTFLPFVDTSPFSEKHLAVRAGLGHILHNGLFYSHAYGSRCFIGLILTDVAPEILLPDMSLMTDNDDNKKKVHIIDPKHCTNCRKCEKICPGGAISAEGFDSYKCVSWLTQKKEELTEAESSAIGHQIYGCDACQRVCPQNPMIPKGYETGEEVALEDILALTGGSFKRTYKATAAGWRGKNLLIRNAKIAEQNISKQKGEQPWPHGTHED